MKYVSVIEDKMYLLWQQEVQIENFRELGIIDDLIVVVLTEPLMISQKAQNLKAKTYFYTKHEKSKEYAPINKPYGLYRLLQEVELDEGLFLLDSDVLLKRPQNVKSYTDQGRWYMSDCEGYLGLNYLNSVLTEDQVKELAELCDVDYGDLLEVYAGGGAQYYFPRITADEVKCITDSCLPIYEYLKSTESKIQAWTAEMWAWLFGAIKLGKIITIDKGLDFCWATDRDTDWDVKNILHLAGVTSKDSGHFYKGAYTLQEPWEKKDFDYITNRISCSWSYFLKMKQYMDMQEG